MELCRLLPMVLLVGCFVTQTTAGKGCIVLMGGWAGFGLYHPEDGVTCDDVHIDVQPTFERYNLPTSGCYMPDEHQIITREAFNTPPMLYNLTNGGKGRAVAITGNITGTASAWLAASSKCISCGGWEWNVSGITPSAECYEYSSADPREWKMMTALPIKVKYPSVVVVGSQIYAIGRANTEKITQVFRYNATDHTWKRTGELIGDYWVNHHSAAALSTSEFIICEEPYFIGGWFCQIYNVDNNKATMTGSLHKKKKHGLSSRLVSRLVSFDRRVYAIGGEDRIVEVYDTTTGNWTAVNKQLAHTQKWPVVVAIQPTDTTTTSSTTAANITMKPTAAMATPPKGTSHTGEDIMDTTKATMTAGTMAATTGTTELPWLQRNTTGLVVVLGALLVMAYLLLLLMSSCCVYCWCARIRSNRKKSASYYEFEAAEDDEPQHNECTCEGSA